MKLLGKHKLDYIDYKLCCVNLYKQRALQTADSFHISSNNSSFEDDTIRKMLSTRGPESIYMLTLHLMWNIFAFQLRLAEGRRASDGIVNELFRWAFFAGSFDRPPLEIGENEIKHLDRITAEISANYYNEILERNPALREKSTVIRFDDYFEQKVIPSLKSELANVFEIPESNLSHMQLIDTIIFELTNAHNSFAGYIKGTQIK